MEAVATESPASEAETAFLERALARVESTSIRSWARNAHNLPLMLQLARLAIAKRGDNADNELRFATFVTCEAMGL